MSLPLTLNYSSKVWSGRSDTEYTLSDPPSGVPVESDPPVAYAVYAEGDDNVNITNRIAPGWTIGFAPLLKVRGVPIQRRPNNTSTCGWDYSLVKLTLVLPDKGEVEFRDDLTDGAALATLTNPTTGCRELDGYRGSRWHATDGSGAVFVSDLDNGVSRGKLNSVLLTSDGTRYRFSGGSFFEDLKHLIGDAVASSITDRNGNLILIGSTYTDPLGRTTKLQQNVPDPDSPSETLAFLITLPGYGVAERRIKIKTGVMNENYRDGINPALPVITGDWDPLSIGYDWSGTSLFPKSYGLYAYQIDNLKVVTEVVLPDGRSLRFRYNEFGEVAEVQYPTGGKVQYDYAKRTALPSGKSPLFETTTASHDLSTDVTGVDRAVVARRVFPDGTNQEAAWVYAYGTQPYNGTYHPCTEVTATSAAGELLLDQRHYFLPSGRYTESSTSNHDGTFYTLWSTGVEWRTEILGPGGMVLGAVEQDWSQRATVSWPVSYAQEQPANDNRVDEERKILDDGKVARTDTIYDRYNNPTQVREYDYDSSLKRRTVTSYSGGNLVNGVDYASDSIRLLNLPLQRSVYDTEGADSERARTVYDYDGYTGGNNELLTSYPSTPPITGHDSANYGAGRAARGNLTRVGRWLKSTNTYLDTYTRYDILGNVVSVLDPKLNVSTISYQDDFGDGTNPGVSVVGPQGPTYALPTLVTSPRLTRESRATRPGASTTMRRGC